MPLYQFLIGIHPRLIANALKTVSKSYYVGMIPALCLVSLFMSEEEPDSLEELPSRSRRAKPGRSSARKKRPAQPEAKAARKQRPVARRAPDERQEPDLSLQEKGARVAYGIKTVFSRSSHDPAEDSHDRSGGVIGFLSAIAFSLFGILYVGLTHINHVISYYVDHRQGLWQYFLDVARHVPPRETYMREVIISHDNGHELGFYKEGKWSVKLPKRCIVCGTAEKLERDNYFVRIEDYARPFLGIILGVICCTFIGLCTGRFLFAALAPVIGLIFGVFLGYYVRRRTEVRVDYATCPDHASEDMYPVVRQYGDRLYLLTGHKKVRDVYNKRLDELGIVRR